MANKPPVTPSMEMMGETEKAVRFKHPFNSGPVWLAKSQIDMVDAGRGGDWFDVSMPYWVAEEKELA